MELVPTVGGVVTLCLFASPFLVPFLDSNFSKMKIVLFGCAFLPWVSLVLFLVLTNDSKGIG